jgi:hypothetical protein
MCESISFALTCCVAILQPASPLALHLFPHPKLQAPLTADTSFTNITAALHS